MDANKLDTLRKIGYSIAPSCGLCKHGVFRGIKDEFGACEVQTYQHQKHTGEPRQLSIHRSGFCPKYEGGEEKLAALGAWNEFIES